jgi:hypothetical protein
MFLFPDPGPYKISQQEGSLAEILWSTVPTVKETLEKLCRLNPFSLLQIWPLLPIGFFCFPIRFRSKV